MRTRWLVIRENADGRPCAWATAGSWRVAARIAERMWCKHRCYPGEERGELNVYRLDDTQRGYVSFEPAEPLHSIDTPVVTEERS